MNIIAFNVGNAIGAPLGGGVIGAGISLPAASLAGAGMAVATLAMLLALPMLGSLRHVQARAEVGD